jgi:hypothetical protein
LSRCREATQNSRYGKGKKVTLTTTSYLALSIRNMTEEGLVGELV